MLYLLGAIIYLAGGYLSSRYIWNEDVLELLVGKKNYVDQMIVLLIPLYFIGACVTFVTWPLTAPAILIWRCFNKRGQGR